MAGYLELPSPAHQDPFGTLPHPAGSSSAQHRWVYLLLGCAPDSGFSLITASPVSLLQQAIMQQDARQMHQHGHEAVPGVGACAWQSTRLPETGRSLMDSA